MSHSLKEHYFSRDFTERLADVVEEVYPAFERQRFIALVHDGERCHGAVVRCLRTGRLDTILARATVIATGGLILLSRDERALGAGFKYLVASQVVSILMLVGIIFAYHATGSLNLDSMEANAAPLLKGGALRWPPCYRD